MWYNHESETWLPAKVTEGGSGKITVELEDSFGENAAAGMVRLDHLDRLDPPSPPSPPSRPFFVMP